MHITSYAIPALNRVKGGFPPPLPTPSSMRGRKKSGMASLSKVLKAALADIPLVQNLKNSEYMEIILNGCSSLAERFSQIDTHLVQKEMENAKNSKERILPAIKKLIRDSDLITKIATLFSS